MNYNTFDYPDVTWGLFLESPGSFSDPESFVFAVFTFRNDAVPFLSVKFPRKEALDFRVIMHDM